jgi:hypothetical protein
MGWRGKDHGWARMGTDGGGVGEAFGSSVPLWLTRRLRRLGEDGFNHVAVDIGEAKIAAGVAVG